MIALTDMTARRWKLIHRLFIYSAIHSTNGQESSIQLDQEVAAEKASSFHPDQGFYRQVVPIITTNSWLVDKTTSPLQ